jgi:hypothetical protein
MGIEKDLRNICEKVSSNLVSLPCEIHTKHNNDKLDTNLIFPTRKKNDKKEIRISEQESRILFCQEADIYKKYYYAIEAPTTAKYRFTGSIQKDKKGQSALSDLSLFSCTGNKDNRNFKQIVNIEFKAHNVGVSHIMKDLLKLAAEPAHGLFFHTLKNINKGTLNNEGKNEGILDKYRNIKEYKGEFQKLFDKEEKFIIFAICIIEKKVLLMKTLYKHDLDSLGSIKQFFSIDQDKVDGTNQHKPNDGWEQIHFK